MTDELLANASVRIGDATRMTDAKGFVEFQGVDGPQTIAVKLQGYRPTVWASAPISTCGTSASTRMRPSGSPSPRSPS